jgi:hypothetical protein
MTKEVKEEGKLKKVLIEILQCDPHKLISLAMLFMLITQKQLNLSIHYQLFL